MFGLLRSTVQMLDQGFCDIEGGRCTVGPKGFGTVTLIDGNDNGSQEFPMVSVDFVLRIRGGSSAQWRSCLLPVWMLPCVDALVHSRSVCGPRRSTHGTPAWTSTTP